MSREITITRMTTGSMRNSCPVNGRLCDRHAGKPPSEILMRPKEDRADLDHQLAQGLSLPQRLDRLRPGFNRAVGHVVLAAVQARHALELTKINCHESHSRGYRKRESRKPSYTLGHWTFLFPAFIVFQRPRELTAASLVRLARTIPWDRHACGSLAILSGTP